MCAQKTELYIPTGWENSPGHNKWVILNLSQTQSRISTLLIRCWLGLQHLQITIRTSWQSWFIQKQVNICQFNNKYPDSPKTDKQILSKRKPVNKNQETVMPPYLHGSLRCWWAQGSHLPLSGLSHRPSGSASSWHRHLSFRDNITRRQQQLQHHMEWTRNRLQNKALNPP